MFQENIPSQLTVMVMVENSKMEYLTVERVRSWQGITFPGGHLEKGESILDCARREVQEETGIRVDGLRLKGLIHWFNRDNGERYLVFCVLGKAAGGELTDSPEGRTAWLSRTELFNSKLSPGFLEQLQLFFDPDLSEAFGSYGSGGDSLLQYDNGKREKS